MTIYAFTSCTLNYIPKATVLARSVKRFHPEIKFCLLLGEPLSSKIRIDEEAFDEIVSITELDIPEFHCWVFQHSVVETCTAVK